MKKQIILGLSILACSLASAQQITYSSITDKKEQASFEKYWQITNEDYKRYDTYMKMAGKYRHQNLNPLVVLSIIAETDEDKDYYAAKAAKYEMEMVQKEIEMSYLYRVNAEKQGLINKMSQFSDDLIAKEFPDFITQVKKMRVVRDKTFKDGDKLLMIVSSDCSEEYCLPSIQRKRLLHTTIPLEVVFYSLDEKKVNSIKALGLKNVEYQNFDPIVHEPYIDNQNRLLHIRNNQLIQVL